MYKTLLGSEGFRKVVFQYSFFNLCVLISCSFRSPPCVNISNRALISILKDMMSKLWPVKTSLLQCVMQTMQILLISCNGKSYFYCVMSCEGFVFILVRMYNGNILGTLKLERQSSKWHPLTMLKPVPSLWNSGSVIIMSNLFCQMILYQT